MDQYRVKIYARAHRDLSGIYTYIANKLLAPIAAASAFDDLESAIISLETFPERGAIRRTGAYANKDYRQLFVNNYTIVYRVLKDRKEVHVITVRYTPSRF